MRRGVACLAALILTWTVVACTAPRSITAVVVLTVATPDSAPDYPEVHQLKHFSEEVTRLSGGTIALDIHWYAGPDSAPRQDQNIAELVMKNKVDLAMVPARTWDEEGVTTLRALSAPFLVTDDTTVDKVLNDAGLRARLLSGLSDADVVGLDLWPQQPRRLFGYSRPLISLADLRGRVVRAPRSQVEWSILRSWGAKPVWGPIDVTQQDGMQSSYSLTHAGNVTANLTPFSKVSTVVASRSLHQRLSRSQWNLVIQAVALTRTWAFGDLTSDRDGAAQFCDAGGIIAAASPGDLDELRRAAQPVTAALRRDPATASLIDDITAVKETYKPPAMITRCAIDAPSPQSKVSTALDGVYTFDVPAAAFERLDVTPTGVQNNVGHFEWTLDHGRYSAEQTADHYVPDPQFSGDYEYDGAMITFIDDSNGGRWGAKVTRGKHGQLSFDRVFDSRGGDDLGISRAWLAKPWKRVGMARSGHS